MVVGLDGRLHQVECFDLFVGLEADLEERDDWLLCINTNTSSMQTIVQQEKCAFKEVGYFNIPLWINFHIIGLFIAF